MSLTENINLELKELRQNVQLELEKLKQHVHLELKKIRQNVHLELEQLKKKVQFLSQSNNKSIAKKRKRTSSIEISDSCEEKTFTKNEVNESISNKSSSLNVEKNKAISTSSSNKDADISLLLNEMLDIVTSLKCTFDLSGNILKWDFTEEPVDFIVPLLHKKNNSKRLSKQEINQLIHIGVKIKTTNWSEEEEALLKRNFEDFQLRFKINYACLLYGIFYNIIRDKTKILNTQKFLRAKQFYIRLGRDLNDRPLNMICKKAKSIFIPSSNKRKIFNKDVSFSFSNKDADISLLLNEMLDIVTSLKCTFDLSVNILKWDFTEEPVDFIVPLLHKENNPKRLSIHKRKQLIRKGVKIKTTNWSEEEEALLKRNFEDFQLRFNINYACLLHGIFYNIIRDETKISNTRKFLRAKQFYIRLGRDLNDRPLNIICKKAKSIFIPSSNNLKIVNKDVSFISSNKDSDISSLLYEMLDIVDSQNPKEILDILESENVPHYSDVFLKCTFDLSGSILKWDFTEEPVDFIVPLLHKKNNGKKLSKHEIYQLTRKGVKINTMNWSEDEEVLLKRNFVNFQLRFKINYACLLHGIFNFVTHKSEIFNTRKFLKAKQFYIRLGKDLNDRPLNMICEKAKSMFLPSSNNGKINKDVSLILQLVEQYGMQWQLIAQKFGQSVTYCKRLYQKNKYKRGTWRKAETKRLINAIQMKTPGFSHVDPNSWENISTFVETRNAIQCFNKWLSDKNVCTAILQGMGFS